MRQVLARLLLIEVCFGAVACGSSEDRAGAGGNAGSGGAAGGGSDSGADGAADSGTDGGTIYEAPADTTYATTGGTIRMPCKGSGPVAVVFLAGGSGTAGVWDGVAGALGPGVLACRFNRPGVGGSYTPSAPLTPQMVADALAETLTLANIGSRFVLVGHSLGGLHARVFGGTNNERVAGAVFLDPTVPSLVPNAVLEGLGYDAKATQSQTDAVKSWGSDAPISVLSHDPELAISSGEWNAADQAAWTAGQKAYAALTTNGTQTDVTGATHEIIFDAPDVVVSAIQTILQAAQ